MRPRRGRCDVGGQQLFQRCQVTGLRGSDKRRDESPLLAATDPSATAAGEMGAGTSDELPGVRLREGEQVRDLSVWVIERFPEHVRRALGGGQSSHEDEHRAFERFALFRVARRISSAVDPFGEPGSDGRLATSASGIGNVESQAPGGRVQETQRDP